MPAAAGIAGVAAAHALWQRRCGLPTPRLPAVLAYHKIGTAECGVTWCTRAGFAAHLDALLRAGITCVGVDAFLQRLHGQDDLQSHSVLLTFDDAFASFGAHAWPELARRGLPAVLFVPSDFVGCTSRWDLRLPGRHVPHLDWRALRELANRGVEIGAHGATHRDLRRLGATELERELAGARACLEDALGVRVRAVSYPFGRTDARVRTAAAAAGYELGFVMAPSGSNARIDALALPRRGVYIMDGARAVLDKADARRRGFWVQDVAGRAISAAAGVAAWGSTRVSQSDG